MFDIETDGLTVKRCARCGETKPLSEFHLHRGRRDGVQTYCKPCRAVIDHDRYERLRGTRVPTRIWERVARNGF